MDRPILQMLRNQNKLANKKVYGLEEVRNHHGVRIQPFVGGLKMSQCDPWGFGLALIGTNSC